MSVCFLCSCFLFKQKTSYDVRISDWSSDVCSSDLQAWAVPVGPTARPIEQEDHRDRQQQEEPAIGADPDPAQEARAGGVDIEGGKEDRDENQDKLGRSRQRMTRQLRGAGQIVTPETLRLRAFHHGGLSLPDRNSTRLNSCLYCASLIPSFSL